MTHRGTSCTISFNIKKSPHSAYSVYLLDPYDCQIKTATVFLHSTNQLCKTSCFQGLNKINYITGEQRQSETTRSEMMFLGHPNTLSWPAH
jgi:hypothetical protein